MKKRWNGSIQSSNTPVFSNTGISREDFAMYRCMITKVLFADDPGNVTKNSQNPEIVYECVILGGEAAGQKLSNVRLASFLGGNTSYYERVLVSSSKELSKTRLSDQDGDIVYVQFIQGHDGYPVIIALGRSLNAGIAAKKEDGTRSYLEFNGVSEEINKDGEYKFTRKGGTYDSTLGVFTAETTKFESHLWMTKNLITLEDENTSLKLYKADEKYERTFKSGLKIVEDGKNDKVTITTKGGAVAEIDGSGKKISIKVGATEVLIDGNSGKISLKGEFVDLGTSVSDFVTKFTAMASAFNMHTHMYTDNGSPNITQPPTAPLLVDVGSQSVQVQD